MKIISPLRRLLVIAALAICFNWAHAADVNGRIKGTVTDSTGAVVPNTPVIATNQATGVKYTTKSQADGGYIFQQLPVGKYTVTASAPGFKTFSAAGIVLTIDQEYVEAIQLQTGAVGETVQVDADTVQVNTTDMQLNNIVDAAQMEELPLIGRNFTGLELIEPGVQSSSDRFGTYSVSGAESQQSEFLINGADSNDIALNTLAITPNLDAIDQFNLIEGPLNAEYDRNSGGIVSATIKQGTNHIHGDAFEFYRDTFLNTGNFFQYNTTTDSKTVTTFHQNIFGGTVGGPILRDKLFAFGAYQGTRQVVPGENGGGNASVLTAAQRTGDFSSELTTANQLGYSIAAGNPIPAGLTIASCPGATTWGACVSANGGHFAAGDFNPIATKLLGQYVPSANSGSTNYVFDSTTSTSADQYIGRIDFNPTSKNQLTFLGIYQKQAVVSNIPFTGATLPGFSEVDAEHIQQYTFDYIRQLGSTAVNDLAVHWTRFNYAAVEPQSPVAPSTYGFDIAPENTAGESLPLIEIGSYFNLGFSNNGPQPRIDQVYQIDDNFSKSLGHHQLKFGYDGRKFSVSNPFSANNNGTYGFSSSSSYSSGDPALDFLLGNSASYAQGSGAEIQADAFLNYLYAQDTWRVTDTFTLNYGLGYQIDTTLHNHQYGGEAIACFIPGQQSKIFPTAPPSLDYPGDPGCTNSASAYTRFGDFGPRIGFAYAPDLGFLSNGNQKKLSIRGGFGIYYNRTEEESSLNNLETPPFGLSSSGAKDYDPSGAPGFGNPYIDLTAAAGSTGSAAAPYTNKFPYTFPTKGQTVNFAIYEPFALNTYASNFRSPYAENIQLSIEREMPSKLVARISYVASLGHHNQITYEGNYYTAAGHAACLADTTYCGNPTYSAYRDAQNYYFPTHTAYGEDMIDPNTGVPAFPAVGTVGSEGSSNYNSLQVGLDKASTHGLQFQLSYTYSHAMDDSSSYENSGYGSSGRGYNQYVKGLNYGDSTYDARQRLVFAPIYVVPFKSGGNAFSPTNLLLSGWQISGITTLATGFPYDISYSGSSSNSLYCSADFTFYACPDEPNITGPLVRQNPRTKLVVNGQVENATQWFAPTNFAIAPLGSFGDAHRNPYHGPGINNTNMILAKNFALSSDHTRTLQIRMESDNVFNHTQFANPADSFTTSGNLLEVQNSGQISGVNSSYPARETQLAAKIYF
jgi:hypothetical protein